MCPLRVGRPDVCPELEARIEASPANRIRPGPANPTPSHRKVDLVTSRSCPPARTQAYVSGMRLTTATTLQTRTAEPKY